MASFTKEILFAIMNENPLIGPSGLEEPYCQAGRFTTQGIRKDH